MDVLYHEFWNDVLVDEDHLLEISPLSEWIACGGPRRTLHLYHARRGNKVLSIRLSATLNSLCSIAFPMEGFICGHEDGSLTAIHMMGTDIDNNYVLHNWKASEGPIVRCRASERSPIFASAFWDDIRLWVFDVNEGRFTFHKQQANISNVQDLRFLDSKNCLLVTHSSGEITCLGLQNLEIIWTMKLPFDIAHFSFVHDSRLLFITRDDRLMDVPLHHELGTTTISSIGIRQIAQLSHVLSGIRMAYNGQYIYVDQSRNAVIRTCMSHGLLQVINFQSLAWILSYSVSPLALNVQSLIAVISRHPSQNGHQLRVFGRENTFPSHDTTVLSVGNSGNNNVENLFHEYYGIRSIARWMNINYWVHVGAFNLIVAAFCVGLIFQCLPALLQILEAISLTGASRGILESLEMFLWDVQ